MGDTRGSDLKAARDHLGFTQEQVAEALGVSRQTVVSWEGKESVPPAKAERYLRVLNELADRSGEGS